jgi:hypothetical protein
MQALVLQSQLLTLASPTPCPPAVACLFGRWRSPIGVMYPREEDYTVYDDNAAAAALAAAQPVGGGFGAAWKDPNAPIGGVVAGPGVGDDTAHGGKV